MRSVLYTLALVFPIVLTTRDTIAQAPNQSLDSGNVQVIEVTAKKYDFSPSPIRVKQGTKVRLKITATDHSHGFKIKEYPEGVSKSSSPGLVFTSSQDCQKIEKNQTQTVELLAKSPGTYPFKCCVRCGWHHRSMKGELVVEP